jgi:hypothetical protein
MLSRTEAREILERYAVPLGADFHTLPPSQAVLLAEKAKLAGYRKPRNANGSTARYYHAYLQRRAAPLDQPQAGLPAQRWARG